MIFTNKLGLPSAIYSAIINSPYTKMAADFSVTELLQPPQISSLLTTHDAILEVDVSDEIFKLLGSSVHTILERAASEDHSTLAETILLQEFEGTLLKGQTDSLCLATNKLQDFKVTTVWKFTSDDNLPDDWFWQQNIYAWMLRKKGFKVESAEIVGILRDWSKPESMRTANYPPQQVAIASVNLLPDAEVEEFLRKRIAEHRAAKSGKPRPCTPEERWMRAEVWAVTKTGNVRATAILDTEAEAKAKVLELTTLKPKDKYEIQHRPGAPVRCQMYCPVSRYCTQYRSLLDQPLMKTKVETKDDTQ